MPDLPESFAFSPRLAPAGTEKHASNFLGARRVNGCVWAIPGAHQDLRSRFVRVSGASGEDTTRLVELDAAPHAPPEDTKSAG